MPSNNLVRKDAGRCSKNLSATTRGKNAFPFPGFAEFHVLLHKFQPCGGKVPRVESLVNFRAPLLEYPAGVQNLAPIMYEAVCGSLGLSADYLETVLLGLPRIIMGISFYPLCPDSSLKLDLSGHIDVSCLTILQLDVAVKPAPNASAITLADQIEVLMNGKYESVEHRLAFNTQKLRMFMTCFLGPTEPTSSAPLSKLVDDNNPALYKETRLGDSWK